MKKTWSCVALAAVPMPHFTPMRIALGAVEKYVRCLQVFICFYIRHQVLHSNIYMNLLLSSITGRHLLHEPSMLLQAQCTVLGTFWLCRYPPRMRRLLRYQHAVPGVLLGHYCRHPLQQGSSFGRLRPRPYLVSCSRMLRQARPNYGPLNTAEFL